MKIQMEENAITADDLKNKLEAEFPDYQFTARNKKMLVAKKSSTAGANIVVYKKRILVGAAFPTMGGQMLFVFSFLLLGILINNADDTQSYTPGYKVKHIDIDIDQRSFQHSL